MRKMILFAAFAGIAGLATACGGDDCEKASDRITAKFEECGVPTDDDGDGDGEDAECTDEAAAQLECFADCAEAADCAAFDGSDADAALDYAGCLADCLGTGNGDTDDTDA
jgi:hypothetical protein